MKLTDLLTRARVKALVRGDAEVTAITIDSRRVSPGALFVCMPGMTRDSQSFLPDAAAKGAAAAMVYDRAGLEAAEKLGLSAFLIEDYENTVWRICDAFFEHPTRRMKVVGITGTNGKTTTAWILRDILTALGLKTGYLGTLGFQLPGESRELSNTTPFAVDLYNLLGEARDKGVEALAMEVSSHALAQKRADGVEFDAAVFTNLTQDHLDFHGSMEEYEAAKWRLFSDFPEQTPKPVTMAVNLSDPVGRHWAIRLRENLAAAQRQSQFGGKPLSTRPIKPVGLLTYALADASTSDERSPGEDSLVARPLEVKVDRIRLLLEENGAPPVEFDCHLGGSYNVHNLLSAVAGARALGYGLAEIAEAANSVEPVPGRFEPVRNDHGIGILVDYAHTPDALEKLLEAVRPLTYGRVITVFGCGGDRDRTKRPLMARAASERSDLTVITSDNPRTEDPSAVVREIETGIVPGRESVTILDRPEAVAHAVQTAQPGDVVVIAGKGHENYQIIGREKIHMDDRELARKALS